MRLRWILVAVTFLLAGVLVLYASDGTSEPGRAPAAKERGTVDTAAPEAGTEASVLAARTAAAEPSKQEPRGTPADVLVVDGASGVPIAGAEVSWFDMASADALGLTEEKLRWVWGDAEEVARHCDGRTRSDERGIARVLLSGRTLLLARADSKFAMLHCCGPTQPPPEGMRIVLVPDRMLRVQALEASGQPAIGVDISTQCSGGEIPLCGPGGRTEAPDGIATLRHLQTHPAMSSSSSWFAKVQVPGCEQLCATFDKDAPPEQPLVFHLPACGSLRVAVDLRGRPLRPPPAYASTYANSVAVEIRGGHHDGQFFGNPFRATLGNNGFAVFARVPAGTKYLVSVHAPREAAESAVDGPASEGACADVRVALPDDYVALEGRLVRTNGEPVRDTTFGVESEAGERSSMGIPAAGGFALLTTDDAGGFVVPVGRLPEGARLHHFVGKWEAADGSASLHVALEPRELVHGWNQLGSVVAAAGEVLVAGHFVTDGSVEQYVSFDVEALQPLQDGTSPAVWSKVPDLAIAQREGAFVVRGRARIGRHRLTFPSWTHLQVAPVEFEPGRSDLTVRIESGHPLAARVRVHPGAPLGFFARLRPETTAPSEDAVSRQRLCVMLFPDTAGLANPQWTAVRAGTYTLDLMLAGAEAPLISVPHVEVPLPDGDDPRLGGIDLRDAYGLAFVHPTYAKGSPLGTARALPATGDLDAEWWAGGNDIVVPVPVGAPGAELVVAWGNFRPRRVRAAPGVVQVVLEPWDAAEAELVFEDRPPLPEGFALQVCARVPDPPDAVVTLLSLGSGSRQERDFLLDDHPPRFVNDRSVRVPFGDGRRPIHVTLHRVGLAPIPIPSEPREAAASESPIAVRIDAEALRAAIARLSAASR